MADTWDVLVPSIVDTDALPILDDFATVHTYSSDCTREQLLDAIEDCEAFVHRTIPVDEEVLDRADDLRIIAKHGVGLDLIDIAAATEREILRL